MTSEAASSYDRGFGLEPGSLHHEDAELRSIAISLKRIADCLDPEDEPARLCDIADSLAVLSGIADRWWLKENGL